MVEAGALGQLALTLGTAVAGAVGERLKKRRGAAKKFEEVEACVSSGKNVIEAFQSVFGKSFDDALGAAKSSDEVPWSYEAGRKEYIKVRKAADFDEYEVLRAELNINLKRVADEYKGTEADLRNYFLGAFKEWMKRYRALIGFQDDAEETFLAIESMLNGNSGTFLEVFRMLQGTGLGTAGALLIVKAALLATSTGVGVVAWITALLAGIPFAQAGALAVGGASLVALSRIKFRPLNAYSASIKTAYGLLDRASSSAAATDAPKPRDRSSKGTRSAKNSGAAKSSKSLPQIPKAPRQPPPERTKRRTASVSAVTRPRKRSGP